MDSIKMSQLLERPLNIPSNSQNLKENQLWWKIVWHNTEIVLLLNRQQLASMQSKEIKDWERETIRTCLHQNSKRNNIKSKIWLEMRKTHKTK